MQPITVRPSMLFLALSFAISGTLSAQKPAQVPDSTRKPRPTVVPASAPVEGEVTHVVKKGDTLWDIAKAYLKDPFRWPEVFRRNTDVVENPHWIYPGEVIRIPNSEVRPEVLARVTTKPAPPAQSFERTVFSTMVTGRGDRIAASTYVLGREGGAAVRLGEIESAPFADRNGGPEGAGRLAAAYDRPGIAAKASDQRFSLQDPVFVELPAGRVAHVGDRYLAFVHGPYISDDSQLMIPTAVVRVEEVRPGELTLARVVRQFGEIRLDQWLVPLESTLPRTASPAPVSDGRMARVLWVHEDPVLASMQSYVVLSREPGADIKVGDEFTLMDATTDETHPAPPVPAALAQVVRVTPYALTALVVAHDQPTIRAGMPAQLTARMR